MRRTDRSDYVTRKHKLGEEQPDDVDALDATARIEMVWQLTLQAWAFRGLDGEQRLRRDVGRVIRGRGNRRARRGSVRNPPRNR
jgi:hypothetical protein